MKNPRVAGFILLACSMLALSLLHFAELGCQMAKRLKFKLPSLRVTQRSTSGEITHRLVSRGRGCEEAENVQINTGGINDDIADEDVTGMQRDFASPEKLPSLHEITPKESDRIMEENLPRLAEGGN